MERVEATVVVPMRILRPGDEASSLLGHLGRCSKLRVSPPGDEGRFEIAVSTRKENVGRVEIAADADLCNPNWHSLIDFAECRPAGEHPPDSPPAPERPQPADPPQPGPEQPDQPLPAPGSPQPTPPLEPDESGPLPEEEHQ